MSIITILNAFYTCWQKQHETFIVLILFQLITFFIYSIIIGKRGLFSMWNKLKEQFNLLKLEKKKLVLITDSKKFISKDEFLDATASALQGGVDIVLLNEPEIPDCVLVEIGRKIRILCDEYGATFIVDSRADIAHIVEADGVQLDKNCISIDDAREILGENSIIGMVINSSDEAINAFNNGADYLMFGPIYTTSDKINESIDINTIKWIKENIDIPTFIYGDINSKNINEISSAGIEKIAVCEDLMYAKIPEQTARNLLRVLP